jgi:hypothetical protein
MAAEAKEHYEVRKEESLKKAERASKYVQASFPRTRPQAFAPKCSRLIRFSGQRELDRRRSGRMLY